ncbi:histidine kinase dimerization/phospho-acceptor domain-containing protein [Patescibacteria group bacterium]
MEPINKIDIDQATEKDMIIWLGHQMRIYRTPLTGVVGYLSMLKNGDLPGKEDKVYEDLIDEVKRLIHHTNEVNKTLKEFTDKIR